MRRKANRDKGERAIVDALRHAGCSVEFLDLTGGPDLLVGLRGRNFLLEVKGPLGRRGGSGRLGQRLSEGQRIWHLCWRGQCDVVRCPEGALRAVGLLEDRDVR